MRRKCRSRRGATIIEFAIVSPIAVLLILGPIIGGLGVFRYQQVAALAREASRYASVHGKQYQKETGNTAATAQDIYDQVIADQAVGLDLSQLTYSVTWDTNNNPYHTIISNGDVVAVTNKVTVTVTYQWVPETFWGGVTLTGTSQSPMWY